MPNNGSARVDYQKAMGEIRDVLSEDKKAHRRKREVWKKRSKRARDYYEKRGKGLDIVVFKDPNDPAFKKHACWYPPCGCVFWSNNSHIRYCKDGHRQLHYGVDICEGTRWLDNWSKT